MTEPALRLKESPQQGYPGLEEIASANDVMLAALRAIKGLRIYLPNNPVLIRFLEELHARMAGHQARYGDYKLEVEAFALRYQGVDVYENRDVKESIAFRIYSDGVRFLRFHQGVEQQELAVFLGIIGFERPNQQDDDIVTQLWERTLPHISYLLEEDFVEVGWEEDDAPIVSQQEAISRAFAAVSESPMLPPRIVPKHLLMLTSEEVTRLRKAKQEEAHRSPLGDVIDILFAVLPGVKDPVLFKDFLDITANLTVNMFLAGEIGQALRLARFLSQLGTRESTDPEQRLLIALALAGILSERSVPVLQEALDTGDSVTPEELKELLQIFGLPSLGAICELLGRVEKLKIRKTIVEVLVELGRDDPAVFSPFLSDPRWYLVRNLVLVLSLLGTPVALEMIFGLISHKEARIRREVLGFLERSHDAKAKTYILKFFRDESSALRIRALQILARERQIFALKPALALTAAEDFKTRGFAEKKAVFEAIGEIGSERMVPMFREMLLRKRWFRRSVEKESAICAVAGLMKIKSPAALQLLEEARKQPNLEVRAAIDQAILSLSSGRERAAAIPLEA
jgi:HEAT repeat protein